MNRASMSLLFGKLGFFDLGAWKIVALSNDTRSYVDRGEANHRIVDRKFEINGIGRRNCSPRILEM